MPWRESDQGPGGWTPNMESFAASAVLEGEGAEPLPTAADPTAHHRSKLHAGVGLTNVGASNGARRPYSYGAGNPKYNVTRNQQFAGGGPTEFHMNWSEKYQAYAPLNVGETVDFPSNMGDFTSNADLQSPDATPRSHYRQQQMNQNYNQNLGGPAPMKPGFRNQHGANYNLTGSASKNTGGYRAHPAYDTNYNHTVSAPTKAGYRPHHDGNFDAAAAAANKAGYPMNQAMMMVPMMMPVMMPCVDDPEQDITSPSINQSTGNTKSQEKSKRLASKKQDLKKFQADTVPQEEVTTLMIRGIPCSFSQDALMKIIDDAGMQGKYNFFYLPRAGNNGSNLGYAFINFVDHESAEQCVNKFDGLPLDPSRSIKVCSISPGDIQGLNNLRKHFRRTAVSRGGRGPVFLKTFSDEIAQETMTQDTVQRNRTTGAKRI